MKQRQITAIAIGCGLACAVCVAVFMASVQGQADAARSEALARYGGEQVEVCVAARDILAGERVDLSAVEVKLWVADLLPDDAVRATGDVVGKTATSSILKGEVVSAKRFESSRDTLDVPAGMAAVSVPAKAVQAVGGAVRPGMSVDVYSSGDTSTAAIANSVLVLATSVGESGSLVSSDTGWITLAVAPEKVQEIIAASSKTSLYFVIPGNKAEQSESSAESKGSSSGSSSSESASASASSAAAKSASASSSSASSSASASASSKASSSAASAAKQADSESEDEEGGE